MGISQFAVDLLTDLILIDLPEVGTTVAPGKSFGGTLYIFGLP